VEKASQAHGLAKLRVPLLVSGAALAVVGVLLAFARRSRDANSNARKS
jgi:hypothetical protein